MGRETPRMGECINCHKRTRIWSDGLCSQRCRNEYERSLSYSICRNCGKHIPKPKRGPKREYCDRDCERAYKRRIRRAEILSDYSGHSQEMLAELDIEERRRIQRGVRRQTVVMRREAEAAAQARQEHAKQEEPDDKDVE